MPVVLMAVDELVSITEASLAVCAVTVTHDQSSAKSSVSSLVTFLDAVCIARI